MEALGLKTFSLRHVSSVLETDNNVIWSSTPQNIMYLNWKYRPNNYVQISPSSQVADAPITPTSFQFDEDILITLGWADGFAVRRLSDDGSLSILYQDTGPIGYSGGHNLAIDKVNHIAYTGAYPVNGMEVYDYSGVMNGGTGSVTSLGVYTEASNDIPANKAGSAYFNGFAIAGDYLYMGDYDSRNTVARWHIPTESSDNLPVINIGSNGYRAALVYEEEFDRMWILNNKDSGPWVVLSASTSADTALAYRVNVADFVGGADINTFFAVTDEDNSNHVWLASGYGRIAKYDISACITGAGGNPTVVDYNPGFYNYDGNYPPQGYAGYHTFLKHPKHGSKLILGFADRSYNTTCPFFYDQENKRGMTKWYNYGIDPQEGYDYGLPISTNDRWNFQYGGGVAYGITSGTTKEYFVTCGYNGSHGYRFRTYDPEITPQDFEDEGYITFGPFTLNNNEDVGSILVENIYVNIMTGTSFEIWVTNNTGTTWEQYNYLNSNYHNFNRRGNTVLVKFILKTTLPYKSPNIKSTQYPLVTIRGFNPLESPKARGNKKLNIIRGASSTNPFAPA